MPERSVPQECEGCGAPLGSKQSYVWIERHVCVNSDEGKWDADQDYGVQGAAVLLTLCLPCTWLNLPKIEKAIAKVIKKSRKKSWW